MNGIDRMKLESLVYRVQQQANELFEFPGCALQPHSPSCLEQQEAKGRRRVAFCDYKPDLMCGACAAYWYGQMAARTLWQLRSINAEKGSR
jgi:hypothetical protein